MVLNQCLLSPILIKASPRLALFVCSGVNQSLFRQTFLNFTTTNCKQSDSSTTEISQSDSSTTKISKSDSSTTVISQSDSSTTKISQSDSSTTVISQSDSSTEYEGVKLKFPLYIGHMKKLRIGDTVSAPFELTLSDSFRTVHNLSVMECCRLHTSTPFARSLGFKDVLVPFHTLSLIAIGNMVIQASEQTVAHVGLYNVEQTEAVFYGDTVAAKGQFTGLERTSRAKYDLATFLYSLIDIESQKSVFQLVKKTLFPAGTFDESNLNSKPMAIPRSKGDKVLRQLLTSKPKKMLDIASIDLEPGMAFVHKLVHVIHSFDFDHVMNFYQVTNDLHRNRVRLSNENVLAMGPLVVAKCLYNLRLDLGEVFAPSISESANIAPVNLGNLISSISMIKNVVQVNKDWQMIALVTIGLKNVDPSSILNVTIPEDLFNGVLVAKQYKQICAEKCPELENTIACATAWTFLRQSA